MKLKSLRTGQPRHLLVAAGLFAGLLGAGSAHAAITITRTSDNIFYISNQAGSNGVRCAYAAYRITNTGPGAQADPWVKLDGFTGGVVSLAPTEDGLYHIGNLGAGQSKMAYLYLSASGATASAQGYTVHVYDRRPDLAGAVELANQGQTITEVRQSIAAGANKVDVIIRGPDPGTLGGTITMTVNGRTGTVGAGSTLDFTPAATTTWPADKLEFFSAEITLYDIAGSNCTNTLLGTFTDQLFIPWNTTSCYTAVYKMAARATTTTNTPVSPIVHVASGSNYKHTDPTSFLTLSPISPVSSQTRLVKRVSAATALTGDALTYTLHASSTGSNADCPPEDLNCHDVHLDDFTDALPTSPGSPSYVSGSSKVNGSPIGDPTISGSTLRWRDSYTVPAGGSLDLTYDVAFPGPAGTYTNSAVGHVNTAQVDTTVTTTDNVPGQAAVLIRQPSDLSVTLTGPITASSGGSITYTILVHNAGPRPASNVVVRDTLPGTVTFVSADNGGTESGGVVTWPAIASIAVGADVTCTITVTAPTTGTLLDVALCTSSNEDPTPTNNDGSDAANRLTTLVASTADVEVTKSGPASVSAGGSITYTITATNNGPQGANGIVVRDTLPAGVTFVTASNGGTASGGIVTWPNFTLGNGGTTTRTVTVTAPATGTLVNVVRGDANSTDPDTTNNNGSAPASHVTTTVVGQADLSVAKSGPATVNAGGSIGYTITVTNNGPSPASAVVVRDTLPAGVTFVSASNGGTESGGVVTWPAVASIANGASVTRTVTATAPATGTLVNVADATSSTADPDPSNNDGSLGVSRVTTTVVEQADISVAKSGPATVSAGGSITYTITVTNNGPSAAASVVVRDTLPAGVTFVTASNGGTQSAGVVTWPTVASLANGASVTRTVTATAPATGTLVNVAMATSSTADPDASNNDGSDPASRATTTVTPQADLSVTKTGPATVSAGGSITYTVTVTNNGPSTGSNVVIHDTLPAGVAFVSASNGGTVSGGVVTWPTVATMVNGASLTRTVTVTAPATGTLVNVADATSSTADPDASNNDGSDPASQVTTTVTEQADLSVAKSGPATVSAGGSITYTVTVTNNGPSTASNVVIHDTLPAGVTFVSASNGGTVSAGVVTWPTVATLANGASLTRTVTVTAPATGTLVNVADATSSTADPDASNNDGSDPASRVTTTVTPQADLSVAKNGPATVSAGGSITYTLTVTNNGPSTAASVIIHDTLPAGVTFVSASNGGTVSAGVVTWPTVATLANGASLTRTVTVTAPATGTLVNAADAASSTADPDASNNDGSDPASRVTTTVAEQADLSVTKAGPATVNAGGSITYTITVTNNGPSTAASVIIHDTLPAGVTFVSATNGGAESGGVVTWPTVATLANGASLTRTVTATAPATGTLVNVADATASTADPDASNNDGSDPANRVTTTVTPQADLSVTKTGPATVNAGGSITYTLTVTNNGPSTASNVVIHDTLPAGVTFVSASDGGTVSAGVVTWPTISNMVNGNTRTRTVTVTAPATGTLVNVSDATSSTADPDASNNDGSDPASRVTTTVTEQADVSATKTGPAGVVAGGSITYTLTVTNNGPSTALSVVLRDTLPAGVTFVSASNGGTQSGGVVTWPTVATMVNGASLSRTVMVTAPPTGTLVNVAMSQASTADPDASNNDGSDPASRVTTVVGELADLSVTKSGPAAVNALGSIGYTITVTNNGPSTASSVVVRDTLPAGVTFVSASNGGTQSGGVVTWPTVASLTNGASLTRTVTVTAPATGTLVNVATATSSTNDPTPGNNDGSAAASRVTTTVTEQADLSVTKTGPATANAGGSIGYTITVTNNGPSTAASVVIRDTLPAGVTFVSASNGGTVSGRVVTWPTLANLANGASLTRTVTVTAPATGTLVNVAMAQASTADPDPSSNDGSDPASRATTTVTEQADVSATKTGPAGVVAGGSITYTLTVTNNGPSTAASVVVRDTLPAGVTFVSASNGGTVSGRVVTWPTVATLANGASLTRTVTVTAPATGTLVNVAMSQASTADPDASNNDGSDPASRVTTVVGELADLSVTKAGPATVNAGGSITYTITVTNNGPSTASNVVIHDTLPAGVTFVSATNGGTVSAGVVTWPTVASLANGASLTRTVTATAPATGTLVNVADATSSTADPDASNNDGSDPANRVTTTVTPQADLSVTKTGPATVNAGGSITYTLTVTNNGPSTASNVVIHDTLPAGVTFVSASNGGTVSAGVVTWPTVATMVNGASLTRTVTATAPASGTLVNVSDATSSTADPDASNNDGSDPASRVTTTVTEQADLSVTKSGPPAVNAGGSIGYTITVTNNGPSTAAAVVVRDTLPAGVTFVSASNGGTVSGRVVTWPTLANLANGANVTRTVNVTAPATGTLVNVAMATSSTADPDASNNDGSDPASRVTTVVGELADLSVTKSGPATVNALGSIGYTITVTNNGPSTAASVVLRDTLPAGVTFVSASNGGTQSGGVVTWPTIATMVNAASVTRTVNVTAPATGTLVNAATATSSTGDPTPGNNDGSAAASRVTTTVTEQADLSVTKSGPATVNALGSIGYTITVTNNGPSTASSVVIRDTLPAGVTFVSASNGGTVSAGVVTWPTVATMVNGASLTRTVTVTAPAAGTLVNVASATSSTSDPTPGNNDGSAAASRVTTTVTEQADLSVTKSGPPAVNAGGSIGYTIAVTNNGPSTAASVAVRDTLPAGVTFVSASNGGTVSGRVVTWPTLANLANGASVTRTVNVTAPATGTLVNVAMATSSTADPTPGNNDGSAAASRVTTLVGELADLSVTKSGPATVNALGSITYTITVANGGPSTAASVVIRDTLPAGVTFVSASSGGTQSAGVVTWPTLANLTNGASVTRTVTVTAPSTGTLVNVAMAASTTGDPVPGNNDGSGAASRVTTTVAGQADLAVAKSGPATVNAGGAFTYTVTVTNNGPSAATSVVIRDTLPSTVAFVSASNGGALSAGVVTWPTVASLANGASVTRTVTVTAPPTGTLVNVAMATSAVGSSRVDLQACKLEYSIVSPK